MVPSVPHTVGTNLPPGLNSACLTRAFYTQFPSRKIHSIVHPLPISYDFHPFSSEQQGVSAHHCEHSWFTLSAMAKQPIFIPLSPFCYPPRMAVSVQPCPNESGMKVPVVQSFILHCSENQQETISTEGLNDFFAGKITYIEGDGLRPETPKAQRCAVRPTNTNRCALTARTLRAH